MSVPTWDQFMIPSLNVLLDGEVHKAREVATAAADVLGVSEQDREILIPSGQEQWVNRANWALSYLARAGAVERPRRGYYRITGIGRGLLADYPDGMTEKDLRSVPGYESPRVNRQAKATAAQQSASSSGVLGGTGPTSAAGSAAAMIPTPLTTADDEDASALAPEEQIDAGISRITADVADQLLTRIREQEPAFFEQTVLDLLTAMGYAGAEGVARRTQLSRDGGIDGIIDQDALGLSRIYVQAKRYSEVNTVGRPAIQEFVGALAGNAANQGVFITTSRFSKDAVSYAAQVPTRVVLIDGERLSRLMIRFGVGIQAKRTVQIVKIDEDYFEPEA